MVGNGLRLEEENFGRFEQDRFRVSSCKYALELGYYNIHGGKEGGIDRLGGGRSKDCWYKWGNLFGGP